MSDELIERLKERACPAGLSHTADEPWSDHGHTDCWLHWQAADALAAAEARLKAVEAERDELHRLVWRTKDTLIAALTGEADEHVDHLTWSKTKAALTGEADDGE